MIHLLALHAGKNATSLDSLNHFMIHDSSISYRRSRRRGCSCQRGRCSSWRRPSTPRCRSSRASSSSAAATAGSAAPGAGSGICMYRTEYTWKYQNIASVGSGGNFDNLIDKQFLGRVSCYSNHKHVSYKNGSWVTLYGQVTLFYTDG